MTAQAGPVPVEARLRAIQSITDAALSRLDDRELLDELLDRTRDILQADTAAVLDQMNVCLAGHFPPVIARPGQPAELADITGGLMIGVDPLVPRPVTTVRIPPGTLLCFYTDGLIERPDQLVDDGLGRLCRVVAAEPAEVACAAVMGALVGSEPARDDIALLIVRCLPRLGRHLTHPGFPATQEKVETDA